MTADSVAANPGGIGPGSRHPSEAAAAGRGVPLSLEPG